MAKERTEYRHKTASMVDLLTGVANRRGFLAETERLSKRQAEEPQLAAVLLIDLDHFKRINDSYGHIIGDEVLDFQVRNGTGRFPFAMTAVTL